MGRGKRKELQTFPALAISSACGGKQCKDHRKPTAHWLWKTSQRFRQPSASFFKFLFGSFENRAGSPEPTLTQGQEGWERWRRRTRTNKLCSPKLVLSLHPTYRRRVAGRGPARIFTVLISCLHRLPSGASGKEPVCLCRRHKRLGFKHWVGKIPLEEGVATHSSILAWRVPWTEEPGGLQSIGSQRVGHD